MIKLYPSYNKHVRFQEPNRLSDPHYCVEFSQNIRNVSESFYCVRSWKARNNMLKDLYVFQVKSFNLPHTKTVQDNSQNHVRQR